MKKSRNKNQITNARQLQKACRAFLYASCLCICVRKLSSACLTFPLFYLISRRGGARSSRYTILTILINLANLSLSFAAHQHPCLTLVRGGGSQTSQKLKNFSLLCDTANINIPETFCLQDGGDCPSLHH